VQVAYDRQRSCGIFLVVGGGINDQYGSCKASFAHVRRCKFQRNGWSDSRNGKLLEESPVGGLTGDVSNRCPQILDRHREGSETDLSRMIPQLMSLLYCTVLYSTCLTYGDGDEIEYASQEVKQKSCLSTVVNAITHLSLSLLSLVSRLSSLNRRLNCFWKFGPSHVMPKRMRRHQKATICPRLDAAWPKGGDEAKASSCPSLRMSLSGRIKTAYERTWAKQ